jgi:curved DNA-binding protein CbpA
MRLSADVVEMDLYDVLGVGTDATTTEVRAAYRRKILRSHPDLNRENLGAAERETVDLNVAAWVLTDSALRAQYDRRRANGAQPLFWYERKSHGSDDWVSPHPTPRPAAPARGELGQLLRRIRQWPERQMLQLSEWAEGLSIRQRTGLTAFCFVAATLLIGYAKPTSLTKLFENEQVVSELPD